MEITKLQTVTSVINRVFAGILIIYTVAAVILAVVGITTGNADLIYLNMYLLNTPYVWGILFVIPVIFMIIFSVKYAKYAKNFDRNDGKKPFLPKKIYKSGSLMLITGALFLIAGFISQWIITANTEINESGNIFVNLVGILVVCVIFFICMNENKDNRNGEPKPVIEEVEEEW